MAKSQIAGDQPKDKSDKMVETMMKHLLDLSLQKGRPVTWLDYKNDPNIDMAMLRDKVGTPASIEQRVRIAYAEATAEKEKPASADMSQARVSRVPAGYQKAGEKTKVETKAVVKKATPNPAKQPEPKPEVKIEFNPKIDLKLMPEAASDLRPVPKSNGRKLTSFGVPKTGRVAQPGNSIVIVKLDNNNSEVLMETKDIRIVSGPEWVTPASARQILPGLSEKHEIAEVTVYENTVTVQIEVYESAESTTLVEKATATMVLASSAISGTSGGRFMAALYLIDSDEECRDYLIFRRENNLKGGRNVIELDERHYVPKV